MSDLRTALLAALPPDPVLVEAGAHNGDDTRWFAKACGHVHAFEPAPGPFEHLRRRCREIPNASAYPLALSDAKGVADLWVCSGTHDGSSSLLAPTGHLEAFPDLHFNETERVDVTTLEDWAAGVGQTVDGLWLDAQGAELAILRGAGDLIDGVAAVVLEVSVSELYEDAPLYPEVAAWLEGRGFEVRQRVMHDGALQGDVLAVRDGLHLDGPHDPIAG